MKLIKSYAYLDNNASFGFRVPKFKDGKEIQFEDVVNNKSLITEEYKFASCSAYTRTLGACKIFFQVPLDYLHPKYKSETFIKAWEHEMSLMGGNVKFLGIHPWTGRTFNTKFSNDNKNGFNYCLLRSHYAAPNLNVHQFIKEDRWATFEMDVSSSKRALQTYHSFCLFRYLWSWHYQKIVDVYFDIKSSLAGEEIEPIEMLQLALYSFDPKDTDGVVSRYHPQYSHIEFSGSRCYPIHKLEYLSAALANPGNSYLNYIFGHAEKTKALKVNYDEISNLITQRKYKAAYDKLKA